MPSDSNVHGLIARVAAEAEPTQEEPKASFASQFRDIGARVRVVGG